MAKLNDNKEIAINGFDFLKDLTEARVALGRAGTSLPTKAALDFKLAHAKARDAVYTSLAINELINDLGSFGIPISHLRSQAKDRAQYLQRPDLGRILHSESAINTDHEGKNKDVVICIADGLSSVAIEKNAYAVLKFLLPKLRNANLTLGTIFIISQGRVAIADHIGEITQARLSLMFIGERPGLSAADIMGIYLTYSPKSGLADNTRNCISNIREGGLSARLAAEKAFYLINEAFRRKLSGVELRDDYYDGLLS
jgi:ethanolamine ammonia-lyase small subunit